MRRYTSITVELKEEDKFVLSEPDDDTLTFSGRAFMLHLFFENRAVVDKFKEALNHVKFEGESDESPN